MAKVSLSRLEVKEIKMSKPLVFKILNTGFSLRSAESEFGVFRVWYSEETWWWSLNDDETSYGSEETLDDAMKACEKHYHAIKVMQGYYDALDTES